MPVRVQRAPIADSRADTPFHAGNLGSLLEEDSSGED
jgi:hypothetical protein